VYAARVREAEGRAVLRRCFEARGLTVTEDHRLHDDGVAITLDGYDASRRVGYELITTEAGDREEVTADVIAELERRMRAGAMTVFLVDEHEVDDEAALEVAANRFLDEAARRGLL
jgi:hypothetical protein